MPASAEKALEGLLADGADAEAILEALKGSGFEIKPPEGDESYPADEGAGVEIGLMLGGPPPEAPEREEEEEEEGEPGAEGTPPEASGGDQKPMSPFQKRSKAARSAMKKHGYPTESDEDDE